MRIITGKPASHHRVRQVIVCPEDITPGKGWSRYCEIRDGEVDISHGDGNEHSVRMQLHLLCDGHGITLTDAVVWRAGSGPAVPEGAHRVHREDYPLPVMRADIEAFISAHEDDELSRELVAGMCERIDAPEAGDLTEVRRWRGDIDVALLYLWESPRTISLSGETQAFLAAQLSSDYLYCSVLPEHSRWTYRTGLGGYTQAHGACATQEEALVMARAHLCRAWLGAAERITELAGGRTDWMGGIPAPHEPEVYRLSPTQARDKAWAEYDRRMGDETHRRGATPDEIAQISERAEALAREGE